MLARILGRSIDPVLNKKVEASLWKPGHWISVTSNAEYNGFFKFNFNKFSNFLVHGGVRPLFEPRTSELVRGLVRSSMGRSPAGAS